MTTTCCGASLYSGSSQFIKFTGDIVAVNGSTTTEKLTLTDLRFKYNNISKSGFTLTKGQSNYVINIPGAKFLAIKATFDTSSVTEANNYLKWGFVSDMSKIYTMGELMIFSGNSTNTIQPLFLTNPNANYTVNIEILAGIGTASSSSAISSQSGYSYTNLSSTDVIFDTTNNIIKVIDSSADVLVSFTKSTITSNVLDNDIVIIKDTIHSVVFLQFNSASDASIVKDEIDAFLK